MSKDARPTLALEGFDAFYEQHIEPALQHFEDTRQRELRLVYLSWAVAAAGLGLIFLIDDEQGGLMMLGVALISAGFIGQHRLRKRMNSQLKTALVAPVCEFFGLTFNERPAGIDIRRYVNAGLLPSSYDKSFTEDQISGLYQGVHINLCELTLERTDRDSDGKSSTETIFQGLILSYSFAKNFSGETRVVPNTAGLFGRVARAGYRPRQGGERVHLEDPVFEEHFNVYSTDQVEARYLLTPRFMERLMDLAAHFDENSRISVAFTDNDLLVCLRSAKDRFEGGSLFQSVGGRERAKGLLKELEEILSVVDVLDLTNQSRV